LDAGVMQLAPLLARQPEPVLAHPLAQRLPRDAQAMPLQKHLARQGRSKVAVVLRNVGDGQLAHMRSQLMIGGPPAGPVTKAGRTMLGKLTRQPMRLTPANAHEAGRRGHRQAACKHTEASTPARRSSRSLISTQPMPNSHALPSRGV